MDGRCPLLFVFAYPLKEPGTIIVDMSTISPTVTQELAREAETKKLFWIDAPVSGGTKGAAEGTLTIMVRHYNYT